MQYKIEPIGAEFSDKAIAQLEKRFEINAFEDYKFHSVFQVQQPGGCLSQPTSTYLAVFVKE